MTTFYYRAKKGSSQTVTGQLEAQNQDDAIELLNQQGLLPISVSERPIETSRPAQSGSIQKRIGAKEIYFFSRQLANLIKSGIPILRALSLVYEQTSHASLKVVIKEIEARIRDGAAFSNCLEHYPNLFSSFYVAMIKTGEESGNLKEALFRISDYQRSQQEMATKIRLAVVYPVFMGVVGLATVIFILTYVMPKITILFSGIGEDLPIPTKILVTTSQLLRQWWLGIVLAAGAIVILVKRWSRSGAGRLALSRLALTIPVFGSLVLKSELARFCRTMEILLKGGIPIVRTVQIVIPTLENDIIRKEFANCQQDLEKGATLTSGLKKSQVIPPLVINLLVTGEESGALEEVLSDIAELYEAEANEIIKSLSSLLEPVMILVVGLIVGFIVMAMLLPIFQIDVMAR